MHRVRKNGCVRVCVCACETKECIWGRNPAFKKPLGWITYVNRVRKGGSVCSSCVWVCKFFQKSDVC